jgi:hypothetical protein
LQASYRQTASSEADDGNALMKMKGLPLNLNVYEAPEILANKHFRKFAMPDFGRFYLPDSMKPFTDLSPSGSKEFIADDNRGAVSSSPSLKLDGTDFYLSVKGIGSTSNPFSHRPLGKADVCDLLKDSELKERIVNSPEGALRYITGELWLRGSPYGGQGLQHATTSMKVSEMADLTSIHGFRVAPLVKIVLLPESLEMEIKKIFWYRRFEGRLVQETRLVPSNVRIYFHAGSTIGGNIGSIFDLFEINDNDRALEFLKNFVKSGMAFLTLFTRSMKGNENGTFSGLDFYDVWLDKDAVLAPDGIIYFVDLEGLEWITIGKEKIKEKIDDQIYRSLYEFIYAYEQIEHERSRRFGDTMDRKSKFEYLLREALNGDEIISLERRGESLDLVIGNILGDQSITGRFPIIDW